MFSNYYSLKPLNHLKAKFTDERHKEITIATMTLWVGELKKSQIHDFNSCKRRCKFDWLSVEWFMKKYGLEMCISPLYHIKNSCLALGDPKNQCDKYKSSRCTISCPVKRKCTNLVTGTSLCTC
jgi:hypothetical protein